MRDNFKNANYEFVLSLDMLISVLYNLNALTVQCRASFSNSDGVISSLDMYNCTLCRFQDY